MNIAVVNTGGTFNKRYNPISGILEVPTDNKALKQILDACHNSDFELKTVVSKDSLDINLRDRELIKQSIQSCESDNVIVIHGTDTMHETAEYLSKWNFNKTIVLTGSMVPMSIQKVEATLNFSLALGFLNAKVENGVYIAMHGVVKPYDILLKDRTIGQFIVQED